MTCEDLGLKPSTVKQAKFEYSLLGKIFNEGLDKEDLNEGLFKRLKNIEGKNKEQLKAIEDEGKKPLDAIKKITNKHLKSISYFSQLILEATALFEKIKNEKNTIDSEKHVCVKTDGIVFTLIILKLLLHLWQIFFRTKMDFKQKESDAPDKALPN